MGGGAEGRGPSEAAERSQGGRTPLWGQDALPRWLQIGVWGPVLHSLPRQVVVATSGPQCMTWLRWAPQ